MAKASTDSLAALDAKTRRLLEPWRAAIRAEAEHAAEVQAATALLAGMPAALAAAAPNPAALAALRQQRAEAQQTLADAPAIAAGLAKAREVAGLAWSSAWTAWKNQLAGEMLPDFSSRRARLAQDEAAARAAFEAKLAEMPAS